MNSFRHIFYPFYLLLVEIAVVGSLPTLASPPPPSGPSHASLMQSVFSDISYLLVLSLDRKQFASPSNKETEKRMKRLVDIATRLEKEGKKDGDNFHFLASNLVNDLSQMKKFFDSKQYDRSAFVLQNLTENCHQCHLKYEQKMGVPAPTEFLKKLHIEALPPDDRARIMVITRQFSGAQKIYEEVLSPKKGKPFILDEAIVEHYLNLSIVVLKDFASPIRIFKELAKSDSLDALTKNLVEKWIVDLESFQSGKDNLNLSLENVRQLAKKAKDRTEYLFDRTGLVYWMATLSLLNQLTLAENEPDVDAELYFLLGMTATMFEHSFWVSQMPVFLEKAIRLAPSQDEAFKAYRLLEQNIYQGYTGSGGTYVPPDELAKLEALKALAHSKPKKVR